MLRKSISYACIILALSLEVAQGAMAQGLTIQLELRDVSSNALFVSGHEGDMTMITGFASESNILYEGTPIGTSSSEVLFSDPPFNPADVYSDVTVTAAFSFPGAGTLSLSGSGIVLVGGAFLTSGDLAFSFLGRCTEGTELLSGIRCLGTGVGISNVVTGLGSTSGTLYIELGSSGD